MSTKDKIIRTAGRRGKTKQQIAEAVGVGYSQAAKVVNELVFSGRLRISGATKGGADIFTAAELK